MNEPQSDIDRLHSFRLRNKNYAAKRLLSPKQELLFLNSLKNALGENVYLISTALGLDIYYLTKNEQSKFFLDHLRFFHPVPDLSKNLFLIEERHGVEVLAFFDGAIAGLSQHPQLFLSCCKKMTTAFKIYGTDTVLNQMLYDHFTSQLNRLSTNHHLPHALKINKLQTDGDFTIQRFIDRSTQLRADFLTQKHYN